MHRQQSPLRDRNVRDRREGGRHRPITLPPARRANSVVVAGAALLHGKARLGAVQRLDLAHMGICGRVLSRSRPSTPSWATFPTSARQPSCSWRCALHDRPCAEPLGRVVASEVARDAGIHTSHYSGGGTNCASGRPGVFWMTMINRSALEAPPINRTAGPPRQRQRKSIPSPEDYRKRCCQATSLSALAAG